MKIAIMTTFQEFQPGYSLTGIVKDQVEMLARYDHEVHLFVNERYHGEDFPGNVQLRKEIPFTHLKDYHSVRDLSDEHKIIKIETAKRFVKILGEEEFDVVYTHDFVFIGWNMPYGEAIKEATSNLPKVVWMHWIHSIPSGGPRDWWNIGEYGPNHKLIYPNETDRIRVAEHYKGQIHDVRCIPHIKDIRTWFEFSDDTKRLIDKYPGILSAEFVQLLPASVDRLAAKRLRYVMSIFAELKAHGREVFLLVANQWATGKQQKEDTDKYRQHAIMKGLIDQVDFAFTSDFESPKFDVGIPQYMIRELFLCSNLFIFPTREESFGLVVPEAALSGTYMVLNKSLHQQIEITKANCLYFDFGSFSHDLKIEDPDKFFRDVAFIIIGRFKENEALKIKTHCRRTYNYDNLYRKYYAPTMQELKYR